MDLPIIRKENNFSAIRMACCFGIVYEHIGVLSGWNIPMLNIRMFMVRVFFCLSGFWVTYSYLKSSSVIEYFKKRIRRIIPQYWLVVVLQFLLGALFNLGIKYWKSVYSWKYLICNMLFMNFLCPSIPGVFEQNYYGPAINGALWTMKIEVMFYILLPVLMALLYKTQSEKSRNCILGCIYMFSYIYYLFFTYNEKYLLDSRLVNQLPAYMTFFVAGMIYLLNFDFFRKMERVFIIPAVVLLVEQICIRDYYGYVLLPMALIIVVVWLALSVSYAGCIVDYSYSLYLVHFPIVQLCVSVGIMELPMTLVLILVVFMITISAFLLRQAGIVCERRMQNI